MALVPCSPCSGTSNNASTFTGGQGGSMNYVEGDPIAFNGTGAAQVTIAGSTITFGVSCADIQACVTAAAVSTEVIQDAVGTMLTTAGFVYNDTANRWDVTGTAGQQLVATGAGAASWQTPTPVGTSRTYQASAVQTPFVIGSNGSGANIAASSSVVVTNPNATIQAEAFIAVNSCMSATVGISAGTAEHHARVFLNGVQVDTIITAGYAAAGNPAKTCATDEYVVTLAPGASVTVDANHFWLTYGFAGTLAPETTIRAIVVPRPT